MSPKASILVVDDEPDLREVVEEYFAAHGYAVMSADSAHTARQLAARNAFDLALVDIHMPGEDGLSLARHLRERYAHIAIVMLTSGPQDPFYAEHSFLARKMGLPLARGDDLLVLDNRV